MTRQNRKFFFIAPLFVITLLLAGQASAGTELFAGPYMIGDNGPYTECNPQEPEGTSLVLHFDVSLASPGATELRFEVAGVAPGYVNEVRVNGHLVGSITCIGTDANCSGADAWNDYFGPVDILEFLENEANTIEIFSAKNGDNHDDLWIRNISLDGPVENVHSSWAEIRRIWK